MFGSKNIELVVFCWFQLTGLIVVLFLRLTVLIPEIHKNFFRPDPSSGRIKAEFFPMKSVEPKSPQHITQQMNAFLALMMGVLYHVPQMILIFLLADAKDELSTEILIQMAAVLFCGANEIRKALDYDTRMTREVVEKIREKIQEINPFTQNDRKEAILKRIQETANAVDDLMDATSVNEPNKIEQAVRTLQMTTRRLRDCEFPFEDKAELEDLNTLNTQLDTTDELLVRVEAKVINLNHAFSEKAKQLASALEDEVSVQDVRLIVDDLGKIDGERDDEGDFGDVEKRLKKFRRRFTVQKRREPDPTPGPGSYQLQAGPGGPQYTIAGRERFGTDLGKADERDSSHEPGPGHYHSNAVRFNGIERRSPEYSIPKTERDRGLAKIDRQIRTGPGQPLLESFLATKPSSTQTFIGTSKRPKSPFDLPDLDIGPGQYAQTPSGFGSPSTDSRRRTGQRPILKVVGRERSQSPGQDSPGPQAYNVQSVFNQSSTQRAAYAHGTSAPAHGLSSRTKFRDPFPS